MSEINAESLATLRILACVAHADGVIKDEERAALQASLEGANLPAGVTVDSLLAEKVNLDAELKKVASPEARDAVYNAAFGMLKADRHASAEEDRLLERIRAGLGIPAERATLLGRVFAEAKDTVMPVGINTIHDPVARKKEIEEDTRKYAIFSAVLGAFPLPGASIITDLAVVGLQVKLIRDIGQYHGHHVTKESAKSLLLGVGVGTGARIAVSNLAKFVPVFGSVVGAVSSYASTWAIGRIADQYFAAGGKVDMALLKDSFKKAEKEGKAAYEKDKAAIEEAKKSRKAAIEGLNADLKAEKITQAQYEEKVAALV